MKFPIINQLLRDGFQTMLKPSLIDGGFSLSIGNGSDYYIIRNSCLINLFYFKLWTNA